MQQFIDHNYSLSLLIISSGLKKEYFILVSYWILITLQTSLDFRYFHFNSLSTLHSYAETVGLEGPFQSNSIRETGDDIHYQIIMRGNLYNEIENVEVVLTTKARDRPSDFKFKVCFY